MTKPFFYSLGCQTGYFGANCKNICIGRCLSNGICNHVDGTCIGGCQDGYFGRFCSLRKFPPPHPRQKNTERHNIFFLFILLENYVDANPFFQHARKAITVQTVPMFVPKIVRHVDLLTANVLV